MNGVLATWGHDLALGAAMTVGLALATLPFGLALGLAAALAKNSKSAFLRACGEAYTTVFRALPELVTLLLINYGTPILIQNAGFTLNIPPFISGLIALSLVFGAYSSEVLLSAHARRGARTD